MKFAQLKEGYIVVPESLIQLLWYQKFEWYADSYKYTCKLIFLIQVSRCKYSASEYSLYQFQIFSGTIKYRQQLGHKLLL